MHVLPLRQVVVGNLQTIPTYKQDGSLAQPLAIAGVCTWQGQLVGEQVPLSTFHHLSWF
jgi:hypothetical protein